MKLAEVVQAFELIAPTRFAESWDNVGLLTGDLAQDITRAMLTIDYTPEVAAEAQKLNCDLIIAYHPPIFEAIKRLTAGSLIFNAIRRGVAIYSPHTALDLADGGTNDMLADAIGMAADRQPLRCAQLKAKQYKLVVFVPVNAIDIVSAALFNAGAGCIGNYSSCSFQSPGTGTFFGDESTDPAVGKKGTLERVSELRIETVLPLEKVEPVIKALRESHPYEEPAFDLIQLAIPAEGKGIGRIGSLTNPQPAATVIENLKRELSLSHVLIAGPTNRAIHRAAVCAGACGNLLDDAIAQKADLYVTGEIRHHDAIKAANAGLTIVCTLHSNSERAVLPRLRDKLALAAKGVQFHISKVDRDPFQII